MSDDNILEFRKEGLYTTAELICVNCLYRYIAVYLTATPLRELECPNCNTQGYIIQTGQVINES